MFKISISSLNQNINHILLQSYSFQLQYLLVLLMLDGEMMQMATSHCSVWLRCRTTAVTSVSQLQSPFQQEDTLMSTLHHCAFIHGRILHIDARVHTLSCLHKVKYLVIPSDRLKFEGPLKVC